MLTQRKTAPERNQGRFKEYIFRRIVMGAAEQQENSLLSRGVALASKGYFDCATASHSRSSGFAQDDKNSEGYERTSLASPAGRLRQVGGRVRFPPKVIPNTGRAL